MEYVVIMIGIGIICGICFYLASSSLGKGFNYLVIGNSGFIIGLLQNNILLKIFSIFIMLVGLYLMSDGFFHKSSDKSS